MHQLCETAENHLAADATAQSRISHDLRQGNGISRCGYSNTSKPDGDNNSGEAKSMKRPTSAGLLLILAAMIPGIACSTQGVPAANASAGQKPADSYQLQLGEAVFTYACLSCHGEGAHGAPKLGNAADWQDRLQQDQDTLTRHAIHGHGRMPPKGGFFRLSDAEVAAAVSYVVNRSRHILAGIEKQNQASSCDPVKSPDACTEKELEEIMTLHMLWLLGSPGK